MSCYNKKKCNCNFNTKTYGVCDTSKITINGRDKTSLNWSEISIPEILCVPSQKPDIENIDQVYVNTKLTSVKLIETPLSYNQYEILATTAQITEFRTALTHVTALNTNLNLIVTDLTAILNTAGLAALGLPIVTTLNALLASLKAAITSLTTAVTAANAVLVAPVTLDAICIAVSAVVADLILIEGLLTTLPTLLNQLVAEVTAINATLGLTIQGLVTPLNTLISTTKTALVAALTTLQSLLSICHLTRVLVLKPNAEGTCLTGRKLVIEGILNQKVVYTANVDTQSVHSAHYMIPFSAYIIPYANFENAVFTEHVPVLINGAPSTVNGFVIGLNENPIPNLCEEFCVSECIEDIFAYPLDLRTIFKNVTLFLQAKVVRQCP